MSHPHVTVSGELIEHEHKDVGAHEHDQYGDGSIGVPLPIDSQSRTKALSVHYPDPEDPRGHGACEKAIESLRQGLTVYQPLAGQMQDRAEKAEGLLDEALGLLPCLWRNPIRLFTCNEQELDHKCDVCAFLSRPEIKERK